MNNRMQTIFCDDCKKDVLTEELEDGTILIHCPKCTGECVTCDCHLVADCFSESKKVQVIHKDDKGIDNIKDS